ncbi:MULTISPECIES: RICIN domain-containing protein [unclassified Streptomyces]|uniref:RICIN domain-containing protein n=1 Tax=unclassified Streptomyces TaxID=2593676 RepID=UPI003431D4F0
MQAAEATHATRTSITGPHTTYAEPGGLAIGQANTVSYVHKTRVRRARLPLVVVPVVLAGGSFLAFTLIPQQSEPGQRPHTQGTPPPSASPSRPPSGSPTPRSSASSTPDAPARENTHDSSGPAPNEGTKPGPSTPDDPSPGNSSQPETFTPGTQSRLENASTRKCVSGDNTTPSSGTCSSSSSYAWTLRSTGNNTFELVNRESGKCLTAPPTKDYETSLTHCTGSYGGNYHWRIGATTTAGQTLQSVETGQCLEIANQFGFELVMATTCNSDDRRQLWRGGGS